MGPRSGMAEVVAGGAANAVRLLVATLAFAGAYLGVETAHGTPAQAPQPGAAARTVVLSSRAVPATANRAPEAGMVPATANRAPEAGTMRATAGRAPVAGAGAVGAPVSRDRPYRVREVADEDGPLGTTSTSSHGRRLER